MDTVRDQLLERPMPNSSGSERAILGSIFLDNALIAEASEKLEPEDFYVPAHRRIFLAMLNLFSRGSEINPIITGEELKREGELESIGGVSFMLSLMHGVPPGNNISAYIKWVIDASQTRKLIKAASKIVSEALEAEDDAETLIDRAEGQIFSVRDRYFSDSLSPIGKLADTRLEAAQARQDSGKAVTGISTGYQELDVMTAGLQPSNLIILAARPGMGKSALALNICQNASETKAACAYFSLEMSKGELTDRLLCGMARIDSHRFRTGMLSRDEWARLAGARRELEDLRFFIDDTPGLTVMQLRAKARRIKASEKKLDLIVVDYLQLMRSRKAESRLQEVSQLARDLKEIAKELDVPLIALSQLSRAPETRTDRRPLLADLRETGEIEQAADVVAFIYRDEYYNRTEENAGIAEIILAKQRNGATGTIKLAFMKEFTRFDNMWREYA